MRTTYFKGKALQGEKLLPSRSEKQKTLTSCKIRKIKRKKKRTKSITPQFEKVQIVPPITDLLQFHKILT